MKELNFCKRLGIALAASAALAAVCFLSVYPKFESRALDWLFALDSSVSDTVYQTGYAPDGEILVLGIDDEALELLGTWPWPRSYMAEAIEYLSSDPDNAPAVIGIDVLYIEESGDPDADSYLAEAAAGAENVVLGAFATFGTEFVWNGSDYDMVSGSVLSWDTPYPDLMDVVEIGHINTFADKDGVIRHIRPFLNIPGEGRVGAFSRVVYERYCESLGVTPNAEPDSSLLYLPFAGESASFEERSLAEVFTGELDLAEVAGKIVLIGPFAKGLQDDFLTSFDHSALIYGVEIHANAVEAYRQNAFPQEVPDALQFVLTFVLGVLALLFFWDRKVLPSVLVWVCACALWIGLCFGLHAWAGLLLHVLWVPITLTILFIASVAVNYVRAAREKRRIQNTFGHYIDPGVMRQLLAQGSSALELGGKLYDIAVLFVDIRGFTTMSEALDPPTVVEIINKYLTLTTECIMRNHGTLDKFVGDCTMAFWNAPVAQPDAVYLACCAAMDMVEGSKALGEELLEKYGRTVSFGVGVNWGPAVIGNIGAPKRMDYTAIGDTVNTAARLEANAPGGTVYISRAVADALGDRAVATPLETPIRLKGKAEGFEILTLDKLNREETEGETP